MKYQRCKIFALLITAVVSFKVVEATASRSFLISPRTKASAHNASPLFVLMAHFRPYREVYASDPTDFALYEDGTVIYFRLKDKSNKYSGRFLSAKLNPAEVSTIIGRINPQAFNSFQTNYHPSQEIVVNHLPQRFMALRRPDGSYKNVSVYGYLREAEKGYAAENVPDALTEIIDFVEGYDTPKSREWVPEHFEVIVWPYNGGSKQSLKWPGGWPALSDSQTIKHQGCERYSLFIHKSQEKALSNILFRQWKSQSAIQIDSRRWNAEVRIPLPAESVWLGAGGFKIRECD